MLDDDNSINYSQVTKKKTQKGNIEVTDDLDDHNPVLRAYCPFNRFLKHDLTENITLRLIAKS